MERGVSHEPPSFKPTNRPTDRLTAGPGDVSCPRGLERGLMGPGAAVCGFHFSSSCPKRPHQLLRSEAPPLPPNLMLSPPCLAP